MSGQYEERPPPPVDFLCAVAGGPIAAGQASHAGLRIVNRLGYLHQHAVSVLKTWACAEL
jgi:hypothetical protein